MSLTREAVQHLSTDIQSSGDATKIQNGYRDWMAKHPLYPQPAEIQAVILEDWTAIVALFSRSRGRISGPGSDTSALMAVIGPLI